MTSMLQLELPDMGTKTPIPSRKISIKFFLFDNYSFLFC